MDRTPSYKLIASVLYKPGRDDQQADSSRVIPMETSATKNIYSLLSGYREVLEVYRERKTYSRD